MTDLKRKSEVASTLQEYLEFWQGRPTQLFEFSDLVNPAQTTTLLRRLAELLGVGCGSRPVGPPIANAASAFTCASWEHGS